MNPKTIGTRALSALKRLAAGIGVGGVATLFDLATLTLLVEGFGLTPSHANIPALLAGAVVQFVGCRHVVFRAGDGSLSRQSLTFASVELVTLSLNALLFAFLLNISPLPYAVARLLATFAVFTLFSFPAWHWVFRPREESAC